VPARSTQGALDVARVRDDDARGPGLWSGRGPPRTLEQQVDKPDPQSLRPRGTRFPGLDRTTSTVRLIAPAAVVARDKTRPQDQESVLVFASGVCQRVRRGRTCAGEQCSGRRRSRPSRPRDTPTCIRCRERHRVRARRDDDTPRRSAPPVHGDAVDASWHLTGACPTRRCGIQRGGARCGLR
jgi:hypothetical protein